MTRQLVTVSVGESHGMRHLVKLHQYNLPLNFRRAQLTNNRIKCGITTGVLQAVTFSEGILYNKDGCIKYELELPNFCLPCPYPQNGP